MANILLVSGLTFSQSSDNLQVIKIQGNSYRLESGLFLRLLIK